MNQTKKVHKVALVVDTSTIKKMDKGQTQKMKLEDKGYNSVGLVPLGMDKWLYKFEKALSWHLKKLIKN